MADYKEAYEKTLKPNEGGWCDVSGDKGGETFMGISRRYHPSWEGWAMVDAGKSNAMFPRNIDHDPVLIGMVRQFYKTLFWDTCWGDENPSQLIATEMLDTAANMGVHYSVLFLQQALNAMNRNGLLYPDLVEDGAMGPATMSALQKYLKKDSQVSLYTWMNVLQGARYLAIMKSSPTQEKFARGWLKRVQITKAAVA